MRKQRLTVTGDFINKLGDEYQNELNQLATIPNISVPEIYRYLQSLGFKGSLTSTYNWYSQQKQVGEKAKLLNVVLKDYTGVEYKQLLEKVLVILSTQIDTGMVALSQGKGQPSADSYLKILPQLCREVSTAIRQINELEFIKDKRGLEVSGATRLGKQLEILFKDEPFIDALKDGIESILIQFEEETT